MADPKRREELSQQRNREDEILRKDMRRTGRQAPMAPRHFRGMLPGGRMYGEDDSVIAYFAGHAWRGIKAIGRIVSGSKRGRVSSSEDLRDSIKYRDYDGK